MKKRPHKWQNEQPIYKQLMDEVIAGILDRTYPEGQRLPSVRGAGGGLRRESAHRRESLSRAAA